MKGLPASALTAGSASSLAVGKDIRGSFARITGAAASNVRIGAVIDLSPGGLTTRFAKNDPINTADASRRLQGEIALHGVHDAGIEATGSASSLNDERSSGASPSAHIVLSNAYFSPQSLTSSSSNLRRLQTSGTRLVVDIDVPPEPVADPAGAGGPIIQAQAWAMGNMTAALTQANSDSSGSSPFALLANALAVSTGADPATLRPAVDVAGIQAALPPGRILPSPEPQTAGPPTAAIAGGAAGVVVLLGVAAAAACLVRARRKRKARRALEQDALDKMNAIKGDAVTGGVASGSFSSGSGSADEDDGYGDSGKGGRAGLGAVAGASSIEAEMLDGELSPRDSGPSQPPPGPPGPSKAEVARRAARTRERLDRQRQRRRGAQILRRTADNLHVRRIVARLAVRQDAHITQSVAVREMFEHDAATATAAAAAAAPYPGAARAGASSTALSAGGSPFAWDLGGPESDYMAGSAALSQGGLVGSGRSGLYTRLADKAMLGALRRAGVVHVAEREHRLVERELYDALVVDTERQRRARKLQNELARRTGKGRRRAAGTGAVPAGGTTTGAAKSAGGRGGGGRRSIHSPNRLEAKRNREGAGGGVDFDDVLAHDLREEDDKEGDDAELRVEGDDAELRVEGDDAELRVEDEENNEDADEHEVRLKLPDVAGWAVSSHPAYAGDQEGEDADSDLDEKATSSLGRRRDAFDDHRHGDAATFAPPSLAMPGSIHEPQGNEDEGEDEDEGGAAGQKSSVGMAAPASFGSIEPGSPSGGGFASGRRADEEGYEVSRGGAERLEGGDGGTAGQSSAATQVRTTISVLPPTLASIAASEAISGSGSPRMKSPSSAGAARSPGGGSGGGFTKSFHVATGRWAALGGAGGGGGGAGRGLEGSGGADRGDGGAGALDSTSVSQLIAQGTPRLTRRSPSSPDLPRLARAPAASPYAIPVRLTTAGPSPSSFHNSANGRLRAAAAAVSALSAMSPKAPALPPSNFLLLQQQRSLRNLSPGASPSSPSSAGAADAGAAQASSGEPLQSPRHHHHYLDLDTGNSFI